MAEKRSFSYNQSRIKRIANQWDVLALLLIFGVLFLLAWGASQMATPYKLGDSITLSLAPQELPFYAARTVLRMFIALFFSLLFTFTMGTLAAKSERAERILIPLIDILQSVPVLSFLSITIAGFIALFPNSLLGPECACIFAIFTAQAWNMALGFYQSVKTVPKELKEMANIFQLTAWQKFWRVEVPFSMSNLLWNTMMSMSASWFFVVVSEAISVSNQTIRLPGIGSYIAEAIGQANIHAVGYAILTMFVVILIYDQLLFRPLLKWSERFVFEQPAHEQTARSWLINLLTRTRLMAYSGELVKNRLSHFANRPWLGRMRWPEKNDHQDRLHKIAEWAWQIGVSLFVLVSGLVLARFIAVHISYQEIGYVFLLGLATLARVIAILVVGSLIWLPIGVWIGMRPRVSQVAQPVIQFLASFPANLIYPLVVIAIVRYHLNPEIWLTPLMLLGAQWYIAFNVIAGANSLPKDLYHAANNLGLSGRQWWRRFILPGIFPHYLTGAITAAGGAWNASIVVEWVSWGDTTLRATGLGEYIHAVTNLGDFPRIALGTSMMCLFVLAINRFVWRPLYQLAQSRYQVE